MPRQRHHPVKLGQSIAYIATLFVLSWLPFSAAYRLAMLLGSFRFSWRTRRRVREIGLRSMYLATRFGISDVAARQQLRRFIQLETCEDLDCWIVPRLTARSIGNLVRVSGLHNLENATAEGRHLVLTTGHVKGVWLMLETLGLLGYKVTFMKRKRLEDWYNPVERWFYNRRVAHLERLGYEFIWTYPSNPFALSHAAAAVRKGRIFFTPGDLVQGSQDNDVEVEFLGQPTKFPPGPAVVARVGGASIADFWIFRSGGRVPAELRIGEPFQVSGDSVLAIQELADRLTKSISEDPASWNPWLFPAQ